MNGKSHSIYLTLYCVYIEFMQRNNLRKKPGKLNHNEKIKIKNISTRKKRKTTELWMVF